VIKNVQTNYKIKKVKKKLLMRYKKIKKLWSVNSCRI